MAEARAVEAKELLDTIYTQQVLMRLPPADRALALMRLERLADGARPPTPEEEESAKRTVFDREWSRLRGHLRHRGRARGAGPGLRPGERVILEGG